MKNNNKGFVGALIVIIIAIGAIIGGLYYYKMSPSSKSLNQETGLKTYTDPQSRFSFTYPSDWNIHTTDTGVYVLTKDHDASDSPGGKTVDFSVSVCALTNKDCVAKKQELDQTIKSYSENQDTYLSLNGKEGSQFVTAGAGYYYSAVIEDEGDIYVLGSNVERYETRYPATMSNAEVKAIFDSFTFSNTIVATQTKQISEQDLIGLWTSSIDGEERMLFSDDHTYGSYSHNSPFYIATWTLTNGKLVVDYGVAHEMLTFVSVIRQGNTLTLKTADSKISTHALITQ